MLHAIAVEEGRLWTRSVRSALLADGRRIAGGWPGTLSEARARATAACARGLPAGHVLTSAELGWTARKLNGAARLDWLSRAEREDLIDNE